MAHFAQRLILVLTAVSALAQTPPPAVVKLKQFSHEKHLKLGNIAPVIADAIDKGKYLSAPGDLRKYLNGTNPCQACHRRLETSAQVSKANMPQMADCLVCHNQIDPPESCLFCHTEDSTFRPANHPPEMLDIHTRKNSGFDKQTCAVCHGRGFRCLGCH